MHKYLVWLPAFIILGAVIYKPLKQVKSKSISSNILFSVYKSSSYTSVKNYEWPFKNIDGTVLLQN
jgi:hypothetical protein